MMKQSTGGGRSDADHWHLFKIVGTFLDFQISQNRMSENLRALTKSKDASCAQQKININNIFELLYVKPEIHTKYY